MADQNNSVSFDRAAEYYDETRAFPAGLEKAATHLFLEIVSPRADDSILEIGVGTGRIALPLTAQFSGKYLGVDISSAMMGKLRSKPGAERVQLSLGDATQLPYADAVFSAVVAVHVFHLVPWRETLAEIARVLTPDGLLLHGWSYELEEDVINQVWEEAVNHDRKFSHWYHGGDTSLLDDVGWIPAAPFRELQFTVYRTPGLFLDGLINRRWSRLWSMQDEEINYGIQAIKDYLRRENINPDTPREMGQVFRVQAYRPPQQASS